MKGQRHILKARRFDWIFLQIAVLTTVGALPANAQRTDVTSTLHNLSITGPGEVRALSETEVCKFCHIPHNAVAPVAQWSQRLSDVTYRVPSIDTSGGGRQPAGQPDGSSRLCLSCHDGTVALGEIAGRSRPIEMAGARRLGPDRGGHIGTDLSGSHPISFVVTESGGAALDPSSDMGLKSLAEISAEPRVRLDEQGKMQCTTCHDPHDDSYYQEGQVPHFWVKPSVGEVCLTCHVVR